MKIAFATSPSASDVLALPIAKGAVTDADLGIDNADLVRRAAKASRFDGKPGQVFEAFATTDGEDVRLALVGTGDGGRADLEQAGGALVAKYLRSGVTSITLNCSSGSALDDDDAALMVFGAKLRAWHIDGYRTKLPEASQVSLTDLTAVGADSLEAAYAKHAAVAEGVALTRELVSEPANILYPESFVERCSPLADLGVNIRVLDEDEMAALGMGALLGVGQGSVRDSRLLVMEWMGGKSDAKPLVLVGKGVTFDTGGISIKPAPGMEDMKWDMGGAGAVAGTMKALASRKAKANVIGVCGLVENMPDGNAQRPGDIVTTMSGQTVEVLNTDAEGRLVLCDALEWAQKEYDPEYVIDLATLTGAIIVALGHEYGGMFSNDDGFSDTLADMGTKSGDKLWRFPLGKAYDKQLDSPIADIKNIGGRWAGSITAAQFLQRFIHDGVKWAHLDIAGVVWADKPGHVWDKGATGFGVRLLDRLVAEKFEG